MIFKEKISTTFISMVAPICLQVWRPMKMKFKDSDDLHARKSSKLAGYGSAFFKDYLLSRSGKKEEPFQSLFAENYSFYPEDKKKYFSMPCMKILQLFLF